MEKSHFHFLNARLLAKHCYHLKEGFTFYTYPQLICCCFSPFVEKSTWNRGESRFPAGSVRAKLSGSRSRDWKCVFLSVVDEESSYKPVTFEINPTIRLKTTNRASTLSYWVRVSLNTDKFSDRMRCNITRLLPMGSILYDPVLRKQRRMPHCLGNTYWLNK